MATTDTHNFNLDLNLLVEEAFERCGTELRTGYDLRTATRSLNLLTIEWANRGINLWTVEQGEIALSIRYSHLQFARDYHRPHQPSHKNWDRNTTVRYSYFEGVKSYLRIYTK
jgi:hypothetical protein